MRKVTIIIFILLQLLLYVDTCSFAEKQKNNSQKQIVISKKAPSSPWSIKPFDMSIKKIPVPFLGHDIEQIFNAFDRRKKAEKKDEFETTEQYQNRLSKQANEPLLGSVYRDSELAFITNPSLQYDADNQILTISLETSPVWQSVQIDKSRLGLKIKEAGLTKGKSMGQNAYGAKVVIEKLHAKEFELAIHNYLDFETEKVLKVLSEAEKEAQRRILEMRDKYKLSSVPFGREGKTAFVQRIKMMPKEARTAKDKISALILIKPTPPNTSYGAIYREATFKDPSEFISEMYYLDVDLLEIWIFNKQNGEILGKIKSK